MGGVAEVVVDDQTGLLIDPERPDPARALAEALAALVGPAASSGRAEELGRAGRRRALDRFAVDVVADQWVTLLAEVAGTVWT